MNKVKQNKITFRLILSAIAIIFSSLTILSLPVLLNYKSKVVDIEKNFYKNFKIYLKSSGKISYKPFPKPHLIVENASLDFSQYKEGKYLINSSNLKIFISLRDIYLRSFENLVSTEISDTNLEFDLTDIKELRNHLYQKVNKPIIFKNCKVFIKNKNNEVIIISPIKKILYAINSKNKIKNFIIDGEVFGLKFKSHWKRKYDVPKTTSHDIQLFNPNIEIANILKFNNPKKFSGNIFISYLNDKMHYNFRFDNGKIYILSPDKKNTNFNIASKIQLNPFYFNGELVIKNKKIENVIDNILINMFLYDENYLGNFNGLLNVKFNDLKNKLIKNGEINFAISEKKIHSKEAKFTLDKIGMINSSMSFIEDQGEIKFVSKNLLNIENHIQFAKIFQIGSKKVKKIKQIHFDLEKNIGVSDFVIKNVKINNIENNSIFSEIFLIKNIHNLRSHIRKVID